jgi:hypothetical protein
MARTTATIKTAIATEFMANETLAGIYGFTPGDSFDDNFSKLSVESIFFYIIASAIHVVELLFDTLKSDVDAALDKRLTHNKQWYVNQAKAFQYGYELNENTGSYDTIDTAAQIVTNAAVSENAGVVTLKTAVTAGEGLGALSDTQLALFKIYMGLIKDCGVRLNIVTGPGDDLVLIMDIWYDPLVLDSEGKLLTDNSIEPAREAISSFIKSLPFNGVFVPTSLVDSLQVVNGIKVPVILSCQTRYGENDFADVDGKTIPYFGYLTVSTLTLKYRAYDVD